MNNDKDGGDRWRSQVRLTHRRLAIRYDPTRPRKPYVVRTIASGWIGERFLLNRRLQFGFTRDRFLGDPRGVAFVELAEQFPGVWIVLPRPPQRATTRAN